MKVIISGGGTGGHVFPAIAIADALKKIRPSVELLFVGAENKLEMQKVPQAGYTIIGLDIQGIQRKISLSFFITIYKFIVSIIKCLSILRSFKADVVVGVGGYASSAMMKAAAFKKIPILIQEQNSFPGITNKMSSKDAAKICVAFNGMEKFFPKEKLVLTGNPVRHGLTLTYSKTDAIQYFQLEEDYRTIAILGGSLGARSLNEWMKKNTENIRTLSKVQWIWQVGKMYEQEFSQCETAKLENVKVLSFIDRMDYVYQITDVCVCRAGALTIAELIQTSSPSILVPSPNVAEDHQRKNAESIVIHQAAEMVLDKDLNSQLWNRITSLIFDHSMLKQMQSNLALLKKEDAALHIAHEIISLIPERE